VIDGTQTGGEAPSTCRIDRAALLAHEGVGAFRDQEIPKQHF